MLHTKEFQKSEKGRLTKKLKSEEKKPTYLLIAL